MGKKSSKPFKKAYLEITNVCNLNCSFCPKTKRSPRFVSIEEFLHLIDEVTPFTDYVYFHLMGEPLLHPNLREFFTICGERGLKVSLTTNGTLLKEKQDILLSSPSLYRVSISVHSFEANQTGQTLEEYLQDILQFCALASQQTKTYCVLRLWNKDSAVLKAANQRNVDIFHQVREFFHLDFDPAEALEHKPSISLCDRVYLETAEKFSWPDIQQQESFGSVFCHGLRDQFGVLVDGTVVPCCLDSEGNIDLGNIYEKPLSEILSSPRAKALYDGFSRRTPSEELCRRCGYAQRYSIL